MRYFILIYFFLFGLRQFSIAQKPNIAKEDLFGQWIQPENSFKEFAFTSSPCDDLELKISKEFIVLVYQYEKSDTLRIMDIEDVMDLGVFIKTVSNHCDTINFSVYRYKDSKVLTVWQMFERGPASSGIGLLMCKVLKGQNCKRKKPCPGNKKLNKEVIIEEIQ